MGLLDDKTLDDLYKQGADAIKTNNSGGANLGESGNNLNQSLNQGMNAAGDKAEEIDIYMGGQAKEMAEGVGTAMNDMGNTMQKAEEAVQQKADEIKDGSQQTDEKKDESK